MTLSLDGTTDTGAGSNPTVVAAALTTSLTNDVIIVKVCGDATGGAVTSISDSSLLTWALHKRQAGNGSFEEIWWADASGALSADLITVNVNGVASVVRFTALGINGANLTSPFDANASIPASSTGTGTSHNATLTISTTNPACFLLAAIKSGGTFPTMVYPSGFTKVVNDGASPNQAFAYQIVSSVQSSVGITYSWSAGGSDPFTYIVTAVQAPIKPVGTATGTATVTGVSKTLLKATGSATGAATVTGVGKSTDKVTGSASGTATVTGVGKTLVKGTGSATGTATVTGVGKLTDKATGLSTGLATVTGVSKLEEKGTGSATGTATVTGASKLLKKSIGSATGLAIVTGVGKTGGGGGPGEDKHSFKIGFSFW